MNKIGAPAWTRFFSGLSTSAKQQIANALPAGSVRSLSSVPLGVGQEGMVFPSLTGGKGESAVKVFFNGIGQTKEKLTSALASSPAFQSNLTDKINLLKSQPSIFPEIHAQHARGYAMERLAPMSNIEPVDIHSPLQNFRTYRELLGYYTKPQLTAQAMPWWKRLFARTPSELQLEHTNKMKTQLTNKMRDVLQNRHTQIEHPLVDLMQRLRFLAPSRGARRLIGSRTGAIVPEVNGSHTHITDFWANPDGNIPLLRNGNRVSGMGYHNIMQRANGQAVISDPLIARKNININ